MLHWTIWGREPGVHEASLRRYGSKFVYHITVYILFTLVTVTCKYSILTQLMYHFASNISCSNWQPPTSSAYKILPHPDKYPWCVLNNWLHEPHRGCSTEQFEVGNLWSLKPVVQNTPEIFVRVQQNLVRRCHACIEVGGRQCEQLL